MIRQRLICVDTPQALRQRLYGQSVLVRLQEVRPALVAAVERLPFVQGVFPLDGGLRVTLDDPQAHNPALVRALVEAGAAVQFVEPEEHSLERVYFDLLRESQEEA